MSKAQLISVDDFMQHLKHNNLIIVPKDTWCKDADLRVLKSKMLRKKALTIQQIVKAELLPVTTRNSVVNWINNQTILPTETFESSNGVTMILTTAVIRLSA